MAGFATGKIHSIYPDAAGCYFQFHDNVSPRPKDGLFQIKLSHDNYDSLFSLLVTAAMAGKPILARAREEISANEHANVIYLKMEF